MLLESPKLPSTAMSEVAKNAKARRKQRGLSQMALAQHSGVSFGSIQRFEQSGQISLEALLKIAFALECIDGFESLFPVDKTPKTLDELFK